MSLIKKCLLLIVGMIIFISLSIHYDNNWFLLGVLACIAAGNIFREQEENKIWNNGICAKYNEPWQFIENQLHTETSTNHYECRDEFFSASPRELFYKTYKGK